MCTSWTRGSNLLLTLQLKTLKSRQKYNTTVVIRFHRPVFVHVQFFANTCVLCYYRVVPLNVCTTVEVHQDLLYQRSRKKKSSTVNVNNWIYVIKYVKNRFCLSCHNANRQGCVRAHYTTVPIIFIIYHINCITQYP